MSMVRYREDEIPPITPEHEAELQAMAEKIVNGEIEVDCSDIPESDALDFKYAIPAPIFWALSSYERSALGRKLLTAKETERAALKAQQKAERVPVEA